MDEWEKWIQSFIQPIKQSETLLRTLNYFEVNMYEDKIKHLNIYKTRIDNLRSYL